MSELKFIHRVSKGSRYNQIYVPKALIEFEVGDLVEVKLLKKPERLFYSKGIKKLGEFKEKMIKEFFSFLRGYKEIEQIYIFGSFLTKKEDYKDIDILIISDNENLNKKIYEELVEKFNLKFHVISMNKEKLKSQLSIDPIFRNIINSSVSNKIIEELSDIEFDKKYLRFLLMLPEDVIDVNVGSEMLYNALRKVILLEYFLKKKELSTKEYRNKIISSVNTKLYNKIIRNENLNKKEAYLVKKAISSRIEVVKRLLKNG